MTANKFKILVNDNNRELVIPIETNDDYLDQLNNIDAFDDQIVKRVINPNEDFEISRFSHARHDESLKTEINYQFFFTPSGSTPGNISYVNSYVSEGFTPQQIYYFSKPFRNSFFKLDFYDSRNDTTQINYITIILPTTQGETEPATVGVNDVNVKIPKFKLDFLGDKEGFFIYWLRSRQYLDIDTFYMSAKFFDAKLGIFVKLMNSPQNAIGTANSNFNPADYFYYKVVMDYETLTYKVFNLNDERVGDVNSINWYEYVNP
jgi:hypothetical protein